MFLCHGASQRNKHSVIKVKFLSSQNIFFHNSLTSKPSYSFHRKKLTFILNLYFPKNCMYELIFKTLPKYSLSVSFQERGSFELS